MLALGVMYLLPRPPARALPFPTDVAMLRITFGIGDRSASQWDGRILVDGGTLNHVEGWRFLDGDRLLTVNSWQVASEEVRTGGPDRSISQVLEKGLTVQCGGPESARVHVETVQGNFAFSPEEVPFGKRVTFLNGRATAERLPLAVSLGAPDRSEDLPSIALAPDGTVWMAWLSYRGRRDGISMARYKAGKWSWTVDVPGTSGDVWSPQVVVGPHNEPWIIWSQRVGSNFDVYAMTQRENRWSTPERLSENPGPDLNPVVAFGAGSIHLAWQGFRGRHSQVFYRVYRDGSWQPSVDLTNTEANNWLPSLGVDSKGQAWVAYDSYRNGNYDVFLRPVGGPEIAVAASKRFEANAQVACDPHGRVWVGYEVTAPNWGKDQGRVVVARGTRLNPSRSVEVRVYQGGEWKQPLTALESSLPRQEQKFCYLSKMLVDKNGHLWVMFRHAVDKAITPGTMLTSIDREETHAGSYFEHYLARYGGDGWSDAIPLPRSWARMSSHSSVALDPAGSVWCAWPTDNRDFRHPNQPERFEVHVAQVPAIASAEPVQLELKPLPEVADYQLAHPNEPREIKVLRDHRTRIGGVEVQLIRGDMHRHTELSWDSGKECKLIEFFRYMLDAAGMDFGGPTDHQGGEHEYYWWMTQKFSDMYHVPGYYVPLFSYERGPGYPWGHKNIFHSYRDIPVIPFFWKFEVDTWGKDVAGCDFPGVSAHSQVPNDTELLYQELRKTNGIAVPHTSATQMGTDWHTHDDTVEPVVEIYQGARNNYEEPNAPRAASPTDKNIPPEPAGYVWNAWNKGYKLGVVAASDHGSTHISYSMVYTPDMTREGILKAIRQRHTYGATDNILIEFRMGSYFMGDSFTSSRPVPLYIKVKGTGPVAKILLVRDTAYVYSVEPHRADVEFTYRDNTASKGKHYYYFRVEQENGELAWSSPIWIEIK